MLKRDTTLKGNMLPALAAPVLKSLKELDLNYSDTLLVLDEVREALGDYFKMGDVAAPAQPQNVIEEKETLTDKMLKILKGLSYLDCVEIVEELTRELKRKSFVP